VLANIRKLMHHVRECNVTLRWYLLHRNTTHKIFRELIHKSYKIGSVIHHFWFLVIICIVMFGLQSLGTIVDEVDDEHGSI
jgi:hypothetical protein